MAQLELAFPRIFRSNYQVYEHLLLVYLTRLLSSLPIQALHLLAACLYLGLRASPAYGHVLAV